jgi:hypothetical protein
MVGDSLSSVFSKQSLAYWCALIPAAAICGVLATLANSLAFAFLLGTVFNEFVKWVLDWARELYETERTVQDV